MRCNVRSDVTVTILVALSTDQLRGLGGEGGDAAVGGERAAEAVLAAVLAGVARRPPVRYGTLLYSSSP